MPFSPSDFEWWMWALFALSAWVVAMVCYGIAVAYGDKKLGVAILFGCLTFIIGLGGTGCALIAVIRFVKWVWG
jgi:hypothetical protein